MQSLPPSDAALDERLRLIVASYRRLTGKHLIADVPQEAAGLRQAVWEAPCAILAHGTEDDPVFFYGNRMALQLFEMGFEEFARLPSRCSAEPLERAERARLLARVTQQGYVDDYSGVRIASSGKRFVINAATVWNLVDEAGNYCGQAATFTDWTPL
ncbi:MAG TPA: MEKHLA domain-containing protein [Gallionella sp.]|nr:MEKHLA domain-containing protein [Gallionella sp.]